MYYHYIIYMIWNTDNGMFYIGQHRTVNPNDSYMGSGIYLNKVYYDYKCRGLNISDHFVKIILYDFDTFEEMNDMEKRLVTLELVKSGYVYNRMSGGSPKSHKAKRLTYKGVSHTIQEWADITGMQYVTLVKRLKLGWTIQKIMEEPIRPSDVLYTYQGESHTIKEWSRIKKIPYMVLYQRLNVYNIPIEQAIENKYTPVGVRYAYHGKMLTIQEIAKKLGVNYQRITYRLRHGIPMDEIIKNL